MPNATRNICGYAFMAFLASLLLVWAIPAWSPPWPGYGLPATLVPNIIACAILALAAIGLAGELIRRKKDTAAQKAPSAGKIPGWAHLLIFITPCMLLMPAMSLIGFIPAGILFMLLIQLLCGQRGPVALALVAVLPILVFWLVMRHALGVPMP